MTIAFCVWILSHDCKQYRAILTNSRSLYNSVSALDYNYYYYGFIDLIYIYTYRIFFISRQYAIHNGTGRSFRIVVQYFERQVLYIEIMTIMVLSISPF